MSNRNPWFDPWTVPGAFFVALLLFVVFLFWDGAWVYNTHGSGKVVSKHIVRARRRYIQDVFRKAGFYVKTDKNDRIFIPESGDLWKRIQIGDEIMKKKRSWTYFVNGKPYRVLSSFVSYALLWSVVAFFVVLILGFYMRKKKT